MTKNILIIITLISLTVLGCKKLEHEGMEVVSFGEVYFDASAVAINNAENSNVLGVRTNNGNLVEWQQGGRVSAPVGERTFEFYDKRNGEVLAVKTVNVVIGSPQRYQLFQLLETQPISIIDENEREPPAAEGQMKMRFANLTTKALPYPTIDVLVYGRTNSGHDVLLGTVEGVSSQFEENYHILPRNNEAEDIVSYYFGFRDNNKNDITFGDGALFTNKDSAYEIYPLQLGVKDWVFSIYFIEEVWDYEEDWLPYTIKIEGEEKLFFIGNTVFLSH